MIKCILKKTKN